MSRPRGTRQITVNGDVYRWTFKRGPETPGEYYLYLQIWRVQTPRARGRLRARISCDRAQVIDPWLDFSLGYRREGPPRYRAVTPGLIRRVIDAATARGWNPVGPDETTLYEWTNEEQLVAVQPDESRLSSDSSDRP